MQNLKSWFEEKGKCGCVSEWVYGIDDARVFVALKQKDGTLVNKTWLPPLLMGYLSDMVRDNWVKIDRLERAREDAINSQDIGTYVENLKTIEVPKLEQAMVNFNGKPFQCECGCNVFSKLGMLNATEMVYRCNACGQEFAGVEK